MEVEGVEVEGVEVECVEVESEKVESGEVRPLPGEQGVSKHALNSSRCLSDSVTLRQNGEGTGMRTLRA